jgi:hypothetical protein
VAFEASWARLGGGEYNDGSYREFGVHLSRQWLCIAVPNHGLQVSPSGTGGTMLGPICVLQQFHRHPGLVSPIRVACPWGLALQGRGSSLGVIAGSLQYST